MEDGGEKNIWDDEKVRIANISYFLLTKGQKYARFRLLCSLSFVWLN